VNKKRFLIYTFVLIFLLSSIISSAVYADTLSNFGVGRAEKERHAGMNQIVELFGRKPDGSPTDEPIGLDLGSDYGKFTTTDAWIRVKPGILNAGKIKDLTHYIDKADYVLTASADGTVWIDCSKFKAGSYFVALSCKHEGGMTTYQILIFAFKIPFDITDQIGFTLGLQNPNMVLSDKSNNILKYSSGFIGADGADINKDHIRKIQYNAEISQPNIEPSANETYSNSCNNSQVKICIYEDINRVCPSNAQVAYYTGIMRDGKIVVTGRYPSVKGEYYPVRGSASVNINADYFKIVTKNDERWQIKLTRDQVENNVKPTCDWWQLFKDQTLEINLIKDKNSERCK